MTGMLNFSVVIVGAILACSAWLILMFLKAWDYWDVVEPEEMAAGFAEIQE